MRGRRLWPSVYGQPSSENPQAHALGRQVVHVRPAELQQDFPGKSQPQDAPAQSRHLGRVRDAVGLRRRLAAALRQRNQLQHELGISEILQYVCVKNIKMCFDQKLVKKFLSRSIGYNYTTMERFVWIVLVVKAVDRRDRGLILNGSTRNCRNAIYLNLIIFVHFHLRSMQRKA